MLHSRDRALGPAGVRAVEPGEFQRYVDEDPPADASYRVGVAANWLDDETRGDVFAISPPAAP